MPNCRLPAILRSACTLLTAAANIIAILCLPCRADSDQWQTFLVSHCSDCHSGGDASGGFSLEQLNDDLNDVAVFTKWERVHDRIQSGEMPPADSEPIPASARSTFLKSLGSALHETHARQKETIFRRLNRREYQNTMNDLFGTNLDLESTLPEDGRSHEFDNVGAGLSISMVQLQRYLAAADAVMDAAIARTVTKPEPELKLANYAETREGETHIGKSWKQLNDGAVVFFRSGGYPSGMLRTANTRKSGRYRIKVTGYAYQSERPITFAIGATTFQRGAERPTFSYHAFPPGQPGSVEIHAWIENNYMVELTPWGIDDSNNEIRKNGIDNYEGPGLAILNVELEGPLVDEFPSRGHHLLFDGLSRQEVEPSNPSVRTKSWYVPAFEIQSSNPNADATRVVRRIAEKAFRRPVTDHDTARYVSLFNEQMTNGETFETALRTSIAAIFCSPDFLYLHESPGKLSDHQLATRLSYFLTRTTPDEQLQAAAAAGELTDDPTTLLAHTRRLLANPKHHRFVTDFTDAWLNLREIEFTSPDRTLFPEFDQFLQYSMLQETREYFDKLITENLGVRNIVRSDFAMLNNRLALHYGIDGVDGPHLREVDLPAASVRGGFLSQGSVLKVSANGTNTSPVVRGVWVMERILGQTPQPPPPGVPGVEPDVRGASTLRELLDKHRDLDSCRACHQMIDPPGFALENFNPVGGWRDHFRSLGEGERSSAVVNGRGVRYRIGPPVDASGQLADGTPFKGFYEFRELMAAQEKLLAGALVTKLLTFATGREMGFSDRGAISEIVTQTRSSNYGLRDIIEHLIVSDIFRRK